MTASPDPRAAPALYRLASLAGRDDDPRAVLADILAELCAVLGADAGSIALLNPDTNQLETEVQHGAPPTAGPRFALDPGYGITGWCVLNARALLIPEVANDPRYIAVRPATRCELAAPLRDGENVTGVIDLESDRVGGFDATDLALLEHLALEATRVIRQVWRTRALQAKARQLEALLTTGQSLVAQLEPEELFAALARAARRVLPSHTAAFFFHDAAHATIRLAALDTAGNFPAATTPAAEFPAAACLAAAALNTRRQVEFAHVQSPAYRSLPDLPADPALRSALLTPLLWEDEVLGVLAVYTARPHRFDNDERRVCATLASLGAVALQNARLYARAFQSEETLRKNEQLTTLGLLAAEIAHEIRNPLTVLKLLHGGLGLDLAEGDPRRTDLRVIAEKLDQLEAIVTRVLGFAKAPTALHSRWPLADIVADTLVLVRPKLAQHKVRLRFDPPAESLIVDAHQGQLQQVLLNLLFNAMEAMPHGGEITLTLAPAAEHSVALDVRDTGSGIPAPIRARIFDSFLSGRPGGTGLGLAIARRIMQAHHGELELVTTGPAGTTMRATLPRARG